MATSRGTAATVRFIRGAPAEIAAKVFGRAVRAGGKVIAAEAAERCISAEVRAGIKVKVTADRDGARARVHVRGPGAYKATWLEYGTTGHFISVDPAMSDGRTARRINALDQQAAKRGQEGPGRSLLINGKPVGETVWHPGAKAHPFMRVARDVKEAEAWAALRAVFRASITRAGIVGGPDEGDGE